MIKGFVLGLLIALSSASAMAISAVQSVDPGKFVGTWYRISSRPIIFEPACACARQVLSAKSDGTIGVYNSCDKNALGGPLVEISGYAKPLDKSFAKYDVHFNGVGMTGSYWVVALDKDYQWTVVSDKYGYSLYVMSRTQDLSPDLYSQAIAQASANGAPIDTLRMQVQTGCKYPPAK